MTPAEKLHAELVEVLTTNGAGEGLSIDDHEKVPTEAYAQDIAAMGEDAAPSENVAAIRASLLADLAVGAEAIENAQGPRHIVDGLLPVAGGNFAGSGGTGKTTLVLNEYLHVISGHALYGRDVIHQGTCVLVTAEDGPAYYRYILRRVLEDAAQFGNFPAGAIARAKQDIKILGWQRDRFGPIATVDSAGTLHRAQSFDTLLEVLAELDPPPVYVSLDPLSLFGPGERYLNDGDAFVASMVHRAAQKLQCFLQVVDHVSQNVARAGTVDQHAARGGTAKTDNARLARQLVRVKPDEAENLPDRLTPEDCEAGRVLRLHWTKSNYAPLPPAVWLLRKGFFLEPHRAATAEEQAERRREQITQLQAVDIQNVIAHVAAFRARDERHSAREYSGMTILDAHGRAIGRDRIRRAIDLARLQGMLVLQPLPADECRGARKDFLDVRAAT